MKLEYLGNVNAHGDGIVRLYDFSQQDLDDFCHALHRSIVSSKQELNLSSLNFIRAINCDLKFRISQSDQGITVTTGNVLFCDLTIDSYKKMIELIEPLRKSEAKAYQWLYDLDSPIDLLLSKNGQW